VTARGNSPGALDAAATEGLLQPAGAGAGRAWTFPIEGERVRLRRLRPDDADAFRGYRSDPEVGRYQGWSPMDEAEALAFIDSMRDVVGPVPGQWIQLAIALRDGDRLVGDVGLHLAEDGREVQVGYSCARAFQRQGFTSEAVRLLLATVAQDTACAKAVAVIDSRNLASERLLQSLGFSAVTTASTVFRGEPCVEVTYELPLQDASTTARLLPTSRHASTS
jgi:aminoglycoside 6'-N-acetyltransferase